MDITPNITPALAPTLAPTITPAAYRVATAAQAMLTAGAPRIHRRGAPPHGRALTAGLSPLMLADRLISLAQEADRAGFADTASSLVALVYTVLDQPGAAS